MEETYNGYGFIDANLPNALDIIAEEFYTQMNYYLLPKEVWYS